MEERIKEIAQECADAVKEIEDPQLREKINQKIVATAISREMRSQEEIKRQEMRVNKEIINQKMLFIDQKCSLNEETVKLKYKCEDQEKKIAMLSKQLLMSVALPLVRGHVERCELCWFLPFSDEVLKELEIKEEEKKALRQAIYNVWGLAEEGDSSNDDRVIYHFKKWLFIFQICKHPAFQKLKQTLIEQKRGQQTEDEIRTEFCCNIVAVLYCSCRPDLIHTFLERPWQYKSQEILDAVKNLVVNNPSFSTTMKVLMKCND